MRSYGDWFVSSDSGKLVVRRLEYVDGKRVGAPRMRRELYAREANRGRDSLNKFVARKNGRDLHVEAAIAKDSYRKANIDQALIDEYKEERLKLRIQSEKDQGTAMSYLQRYALDFFTRLDKPDVLEWHRQKDLWKRYLLNSPTDDSLQDNLRIIPEGRLLAKKVIQQVVFELNEFLAFMHDKRPEEVPPIRILPFRKNDALLRYHEATRKLLEEERDARYIPKKHLERIKAALREKGETEDGIEFSLHAWADFADVAYAYGLRRNEVLGLTIGDIYEDHLSVERQLVTYHPDANLRVYGPVKNRASRQVPHWIMTPDELYDKVENIQNWVMHPDTITKKFVEVTSSLFAGEVTGGYIPHDLRRSWISDMLRVQIAEDVRLAAGHGNLATTYKHYAKDTREHSKKRFVPKRKIAS